VIAGISNAGIYSNKFRQEDATGLLDTFLAETWDFDSGYVKNAAHRMKALGKPIKRYWQSLSGGDEAGDETVFRLPFSRWQLYSPALADPGSEIPPLPPAAPNSTLLPDTADPEKTHHLIRDFMFLHAALHNATTATPPGVSTVSRPTGPGAFQIVRIPLASPSADDAQLPKFTRGTGRHQVDQKLLVQPASVGPPGATGDLTFKKRSLKFVSLLYKLIQNGDDVTDVTKGPNWFGVAIPDTGFTQFTNVVIYFHPTPGQAKYDNADYQAKTGTRIPPLPRRGDARTNWKELNGYVDRLGCQLAGAIQEGGSTDQIVILPFMREPDNRNIVETLINDQWYFIVRDILIDIAANGIP
jgi:hypothetical protein